MQQGQVCPMMTQWQKVLLAAHEVSLTEKAFTTESLTVAAWKLYPETFALKGFPAYPDSHKVAANLMGDRGLRKQGYVANLGPRRWCLLPKGRELVYSLLTLLNGGTPPTTPEPVAKPEPVKKVAAANKVKLTADQERWLDGRLSFLGTADYCSFTEACDFWRTNATMDPDVALAREADLLQAIGQALSGGKETVLFNGRHVSMDAVLALSLHFDTLEKRFERQIKFWRLAVNKKPALV